MNLPNQLSAARIIAVPLFLLLLLLGHGLERDGSFAGASILYVLSLLLTIAVTVTDWLDGKIARERGLITTLGKLLDPLADKIFVAAALIALTAMGLIPSWAVVLIIAREFLITGLRSLATEQGRVIAADRLGKHKTGWQLGLIITALFLLSVRALLQNAGLWQEPVVASYQGAIVFEVMIWIPLLATLWLTVASAWLYVKQNLDLFAGET